MRVKRVFFLLLHCDKYSFYTTVQLHKPMNPILNRFRNLFVNSKS